MGGKNIWFPNDTMSLDIFNTYEPATLKEIKEEEEMYDYLKKAPDWENTVLEDTKNSDFGDPKMKYPIKMGLKKSDSKLKSADKKGMADSDDTKGTDTADPAHAPASGPVPLEKGIKKKILTGTPHDEDVEHRIKKTQESADMFNKDNKVIINIKRIKYTDKKTQKKVDIYAWRIKTVTYPLSEKGDWLNKPIDNFMKEHIEIDKKKVPTKYHKEINSASKNGIEIIVKLTCEHQKKKGEWVFLIEKFHEVAKPLPMPVSKPGAWKPRRHFLSAN